MLANLGLSVVSVVAIIVVLEMALRIHASGKAHPPGLPPRDNEWTFFEYDPVLGWRNKPGADGTFAMQDSRSRVWINSKGLRDVEHAYDKGGRFRILVLGDSFTWGFGVEQNERFPDRLQADLGHGVEVIDAGVSGWGTDQELLYLQNEGIRYSPDLVIVAFGIEDFLNNASSVQYSYPKPYFVLEGGRLALRNVPVPRRPRSWRERWQVAEQEEPAWGWLGRRLYHGSEFLRTHLRSFDFVDWRVRKLIERIEGADGPMDPVTAALLVALRDFTESRKARLLVVLIPYRASVHEHRPPAEWAQLTTFLRERDLSFLDLFPVFDRISTAEQDLYFKIDPHWNAAGHTRAAWAIEEYLIRHHLVSTASPGSSLRDPDRSQEGSVQAPPRTAQSARVRSRTDRSSPGEDAPPAS